jgi:hypothetical protein
MQNLAILAISILVSNKLKKKLDRYILMRKYSCLLGSAPLSYLHSILNINTFENTVLN